MFSNSLVFAVNIKATLAALMFQFRYFQCKNYCFAMLYIFMDRMLHGNLGRDTTCIQLWSTLTASCFRFFLITDYGK
jgi:hypothetical protein